MKTVQVLNGHKLKRLGMREPAAYGSQTLIELHISSAHAREAFRHHPYISPSAKAVMAGFGVKGYPLALAGLAEMAV